MIFGRPVYFVGSRVFLRKLQESLKNGLSLGSKAAFVLLQAF